MCSSPKGSTKYRRHTRKKEVNPMEYQEYSLMVKRASARYEEIQQRKAEKLQEITDQSPVLINKPTVAATKHSKIHLGILSVVKAFLMKQVVLKA